MYNDKKNREDRPIWLTSLAEADCDTLPAASIEDRLQGALRRRRQRILSQRVGGVVLAVGLAFGCWRISTINSDYYSEIVDNDVADAITEAIAFTGDDDSDFVPTKLASEQPLESVKVVRVSLPSGVLANYGLSSTDVPATASGDVNAELLVGQDGIARAIRLVK